MTPSRAVCELFLPSRAFRKAGASGVCARLFTGSCRSAPAGRDRKETAATGRPHASAPSRYGVSCLSLSKLFEQACILLKEKNNAIEPFPCSVLTQRPVDTRGSIPLCCVGTLRVREEGGLAVVTCCWHASRSLLCSKRYSVQGVWAMQVPSSAEGVGPSEQDTRQTMELDTERSRESVASGFAWAPEHMQTPQKTPAAEHSPSGAAGARGQALDQRRIPGGYMQTRSLGHITLELDKAPQEIPRHLQTPAHPLGTLLGESTSMSMLFCGRAVVGQWRLTRRCCGEKGKKEVARTLPQCAVLGIDDGLERLLVTGKGRNHAKNNERPFKISQCTRVICLPCLGHGSNDTPLELTDCKDVKCKGSGNRMRVEIVQADGRSLWLYNVGFAQYYAITECISACHSYARIKKEKEAALVSASDVARDAEEVTQPIVQNSSKEHASSETAGSPSKPAVPKLCLDGVGNYSKQAVQSVPIEIQMGEKAPLKEIKPLRRDIAVAKTVHLSSQPLSVSSAVRAAEALIDSNGLQPAQDKIVTATTGHVYVQGGSAESLKDPISRIKPGQLEDALQTGPVFHKHNWLDATCSTPPMPPPIAASRGEGGGFRSGSAANSREDLVGGLAGPPAAGLAVARRAVPRVVSAAATPPLYNGGSPQQPWQQSSAGSSISAHGQPKYLMPVTSPPPRRLPRLVSMSPEKPIVAEANDIQTALDNVRLHFCCHSIFLWLCYLRTSKRC